MQLFDKLKEALIGRAAEGLSASLTVLLAWAAYQVVPAILPAIEAAVSKRVLLAILIVSLVLNVLFLIVIWITARKEPFRLRYGIYWDQHKNPHCPSCRTPLAAYGNYQTSGRGYYCKPCKQVYPLADASGSDMDPENVLKEL